MADVIHPEAASATLDKLEPKILWQHFYKLSEIPRPSGFEQRVLEFLINFATVKDLVWKQDAVGNLVIRKLGTGGGEHAPPVVIQAHIDMVCEKNDDVVHNFYQDPLRLRLDGEWLKATGTTLGADNGIGVATALALLDCAPSVKLPPLECLFTVDEETGLTGAFGISNDLLEGRTMLNLDSEQWGSLTIGCAGGGDSILQLTLPTRPVGLQQPQAVPMQLIVDGLMGGHSGLNINEDRGNAVILAAQLVKAILKEVAGVQLVSFAGGDKRNAIPRQASAVLLVPADQEDAAAKVVRFHALAFQSEFGALEKDMKINWQTLEAGAAPGRALEMDGAKRLLTLLTSLPHGVKKYSHAVQGLVETSNNLGSVKSVVSPRDASSVEVSVVCCTRSSYPHALELLRDNIEDIATLCGARVTREKAYPGWAPNPSSAVVQVAKAAMEDVLGSESHLTAIHAGLECGILAEKFPGMDVVSYGPTIENAHSPDECCKISTVPPFWQTTLSILSTLADRTR